MNNEVVEAYLQFLWLQFQYDWSILSNPWVLYTIIPAVLYVVFFMAKWWILLVPITLPLTIISSRGSTSSPNSSDNVKKELTTLLRN
jgi:hypothetical protein